MLENEFFPTPKAIAEEMIRFAGSMYKKGFSATILDPSGGSGAILDVIQDKYNYHPRELYTIEIDQDLVYTLQGKGYTVLGNDFLGYDEPTTFDYILMNPPFSNGDDHVMKAYNHLNDEGVLIALLNAQTIKNPHSKTRKNLIDLICRSLNYSNEDCRLQYTEDNHAGILEQLEEHKRIKWLGSCFKHSDRSTSVEVVMIKITKPKSNFSYNFNEIAFDLDAEVKDVKYNPNILANKDVIRDLVARYNATRKILLNRYEMQNKLDFFLNGIENPVYDSTKNEGLENKVDLNKQLLCLKSRFWNTVFLKTDIGNRATSNFRKKFEQFARQQSSIAFTEENVKEVLLLFIANMSDMMKDCVIEVFDKATQYHEKNKIHEEGWKTNKSWKLNKKIILPYGVKYSYDSFHPDYYSRDFLDDLDKVVRYLSSEKSDNIKGSYQAISEFCSRCNSRKESYSTSFENRFFRFKIFKKGTLHIEFKELKILERINLIAAEGKKWIGQGA